MGLQLVFVLTIIIKFSSIVCFWTVFARMNSPPEVTDKVGRTIFLPECILHRKLLIKWVSRIIQWAVHIKQENAWNLPGNSTKYAIIKCKICGEISEELASSNTYAPTSFGVLKVLIGRSISAIRIYRSKLFFYLRNQNVGPAFLSTQKWFESFASSENPVEKVFPDCDTLSSEFRLRTKTHHLTLPDD